MKKAIDKLATGFGSFKKSFGDVLTNDDLFNVIPIRLLGKDVPKENKMKRWMTSTDVDNGGSSFCSFTANDNLVFKGRVVFDESIALRTKTRSGYCGLRGTFEETVDLRDYEGVEIFMKSNVPLILTVNMGCESFFESDIFQFHFQVHDTWRKYHVPFNKFM